MNLVSQFRVTPGEVSNADVAFTKPALLDTLGCCTMLRLLSTNHQLIRVACARPLLAVHASAEVGNAAPTMLRFRLFCVGWQSAERFSRRNWLDWTGSLVKEALTVGGYMCRSVVRSRNCTVEYLYI